MRTWILVLIVVVSVGAVISISALGNRGASAAIPNDQCYQLASNKDNALAQSLGDPYSSGFGTNPFTGQLDSFDFYISDRNGVTSMRWVYGNGDALGYIGLTRYWVTHDGRAKVLQRIYGPIWSKAAWGFWFNFPFDDDPSTWIKEKVLCNTLKQIPH